MSRVIRVTSPSAEPVSLNDAKDHLRVDGTDDNTLISLIISAARDAAERYCNRAWAEATFIQSFERFPIAGPLRLIDIGAKLVTSIEYMADDGTIATISGSSLTLDSDLGLIDYALDWPAGTRVKVTYVAGANADQSAPEYVPESVIFAIKLMLTDYYENRNAQQWQQLYVNPTSERLLHSYRVGLGV